MALFAEIDENNNVVNVIVADQEFIDSLPNASSYIETDYYTQGGVHLSPETGEPDGGVALRKNYANIGGVYDPARDAFYRQQPFASWVLDEDTCLWQPPVAHPNDGNDYNWDEQSTSWVLRVGGE